MLNKFIKLNNKKLIIIIFFIVLSIISLCGYRMFDKKSRISDTKPLDYNELIAAGADVGNMYVSVDIVNIPYQIAEQKVNHMYIKYYILYDKEGYMYVAKLSDKTYKKINDEYQDNKDNFSYTLVGYIYKTPNDLKEIIIDVFNENNTNNKISKDDFADYFGSTYLDDSYTKYTAQAAICGIITIVGIIIFIIILISWIICNINIKKTLSSVGREQLESELSNNNLKEYKKAKIYLTDKFLIFTHKGLQVCNYTDIGWIYLGNSCSKISSVNKIHMNVFMNDKKKYKSKKLDYDKQYMFEEIISEIANKNSNVMIGYTYDNMNKYNKINN